MKYKTFFLLAALASCVCLVPQAHAGVVVTSSGVGQHAVSYSGIVYDNLDALVVGTQTPQTTATGIDVLLTPDAAVVNTALSGKYARPVLSGGQGALFGTPDGTDMTTYLTSGRDGSPNVGAQVELQFSSKQNYFGLLWGSVDTYNTLEFYNGLTLVGSITGSAVKIPANGNQSTLGTVYANILLTGGDVYDRVVATSSSYAFEFDNVAYGVVPEPAAMLAWGVLGLVGVVAVRRARRRA